MVSAAISFAIAGFKLQSVGKVRSLLPSPLDGSFSSYSEDMWSLGVSLYYLCFLRSVIPSESLIDRAQNNENYSQLPDMAKASPELQSLLGQLLNPEVSERPCLRDVLVGVRRRRDVGLYVVQKAWIFLPGPGGGRKVGVRSEVEL